MRFAFVEEHLNELPANRLCQIMDVSPRGYRAWRSRPASHRQRIDKVLLAHFRDQYRLSLGSYGRRGQKREKIIPISPGGGITRHFLRFEHPEPHANQGTTSQFFIFRLNLTE
tara:strand:- start:211 stop:549 length:339 start_codon:yes stop_codon:yes gene_type:complete